MFTKRFPALVLAILVFFSGGCGVVAGKFHSNIVSSKDMCSGSYIRGIIRSASFVRLPIIYDHQKGATDIPKMGEEFALAVREGGADAAILFSLAGPVVAEKWIMACQKEELGVIVGGHMTHEKFLESDGGYIMDMAPFSIYTVAAEMGVTKFVVPGNKPKHVGLYRGHLLGGGVDIEKLELFAPGFVTQGGDISETGIMAV